MEEMHEDKSAEAKHVVSLVRAMLSNVMTAAVNDVKQDGFIVADLQLGSPAKIKLGSPSQYVPLTAVLYE